MIKFKDRIKQSNSKLIRFTSLEFFFWSTMSAYYPFLVVFLIYKGYSSTVIGTILAINSLVVVLAQPFWGMASDWVRSVKKVFILCLATSGCIILTLPLYQSVFVIGLVLAIITFFESAMGPLLDSWVIQGIQSEESITYGNVRLWGSLGFSIFAYIAGTIVDFTSILMIFPIFAVLAAITIVFSTRVKSDEPLEHFSLADLKIGRLIKNYDYVIFVFFALTLFIPHRGSLLFLAKLMEQLGGTQEEFGLCFSVMALSEVPIFLFSQRLIKKYKPIHLILVSTVFFVLRQVFFLLASKPIHVILLQTLQGPAFALFLTGTVYYIDSLAPQELKSTAQTLASAIFFGGSGIIGSYSGGWFIDHLSLKQMYQVGIVISIVISVLFVLSFPIGRIVRRSSI